MLSTVPSTSDCTARCNSPTTPTGSRSGSNTSLIVSPHRLNLSPDRDAGRWRSCRQTAETLT